MLIQHHRKRVGAGGLGHCGQTAAVDDRQPRRVVVGGADAHGNVGQGVVIRVGAGRSQRDVVDPRAVCQGIVLAGDGDGGIGVPVGGRERQRTRIHRALIGVAAGHRDGHVRRRLRVQPDGEAGGTAGLGRLSHYRSRHQPRRVVVGGAHAHGLVRYDAVASVAGVAAGRGQRDVVGLRAIVQVIVHAGHRNHLRANPVGGCKRQRARTRRALVGGAAGHRDGHVRRRFAGQRHREARGTAHLRRLTHYRPGRHPSLVVVGDRQRGARNGAHAHAVLRRGRHRNAGATRALVKGIVHRRDRHRVVAGGVARRNRDDVER